MPKVIKLTIRKEKALEHIKETLKCSNAEAVNKALHAYSTYLKRFL